MLSLGSLLLLGDGHRCEEGDRDGYILDVQAIIRRASRHVPYDLLAEYSHRGSSVRRYWHRLDRDALACRSANYTRGGARLRCAGPHAPPLSTA